MAKTLKLKGKPMGKLGAIQMVLVWLFFGALVLFLLMLVVQVVHKGEIRPSLVAVASATILIISGAKIILEIVEEKLFS